MRGAVRYDLDPLASDSPAVRHPNALAVAVAAMRVAGVRIRLLHGAVAIEDIHMVWKRRVGVLDKPCPHNRVRKAVSTRQTAATVQSGCDGGQESGPKPSPPFIHLRSIPMDASHWRPKSYRENLK